MIKKEQGIEVNINNITLDEKKSLMDKKKDIEDEAIKVIVGKCKRM